MRHRALHTVQVRLPIWIWPASGGKSQSLIALLQESLGSGPWMVLYYFWWHPSHFCVTKGEVPLSSFVRVLPMVCGGKSNAPISTCLFCTAHILAHYAEKESTKQRNRVRCMVEYAWDQQELEAETAPVGGDQEAGAG